MYYLELTQLLYMFSDGRVQRLMHRDTVEIIGCERYWIQIFNLECSVVYGDS